MNVNGQYVIPEFSRNISNFVRHLMYKSKYTFISLVNLGKSLQKIKKLEFEL